MVSAVGSVLICLVVHDLIVNMSHRVPFHLIVEVCVPIWLLSFVLVDSIEFETIERSDYILNGELKESTHRVRTPTRRGRGGAARPRTSRPRSRARMRRMGMRARHGCGHYVVKKRWHERLREKSDLDRRDIRRQPAHRLINA